MRSSPGPSRTGKGAGRPVGGDAGRAAGPAARWGAALDAAGFDAWLGAAGPLPPSLYLEGSDEAAKAEALVRLRERWAETQAGAPPTVLRASEAGIEHVLAEAQGGSLFQPAVLVLVLNVEEWARSPRAVAAAAQGAAAIPEGNAVLFVESAAETERKSMAPLAEACALRVTLDALPPEVLARWAARRLERLGVRAGPGAIEAVLEVSRLETGEVLNEMEKLADWAGPGGTVDREEALAVLRPVYSGSLPALARAVAERRGDDAVDHLLRSLEAGESPGTVLFQLQTLISGALRVRSRQWGWVRDRANSERLARDRDERELAAALDLLYRVERAWKSGRGEVETLLVRAVIGLAGAAPAPRAR